MSAYREESIVRVSYTLEPQELESEWRPISRARVRTVRLLVAGTVAIAGIVFILTLPRFVAQVALAVGAALVGWFVWRMKTESSAKQAYGDAWEDRRQVELEVTENELAMSDRVGMSRLAWDLVLHWRETEGSLLIYTTPEAFHVIPKRALSPEQLTTLRQLCSDGVRAGGQATIDASERTTWVPFAGYYLGLALLVLGVVEGVARTLAGGL